MVAFVKGNLSGAKRSGLPRAKGCAERRQALPRLSSSDAGARIALQTLTVNFRIADDSRAESSSTQVVVPPCAVNQLLDRFAWSVNDRSRSNVSSFGGHHAQEKGRRPSAREAHAQNNLYPRIALSVAAFCGAKRSVIHVSGRFSWVKVNGQWLYKTRQIGTGRNKHPARGMLWRLNHRARIPSALRSAKPIRWRIR